MTEEKSPLVKALDAIKRQCWEFELGTLLGKKADPLGKVRMRVATVGEQNKALLGAEKYLKELGEVRGEIAADIMGNAKVAYLMHQVCLDMEKDRPAFPSGKYIQDTLSSDQLAVILNFYQECLRLSGAIDLDLDDDKIEGLAAMLAHHADSDAPNFALMSFTGAQLTEIVMRLALKLQEARKAQKPAEELAALAPNGEWSEPPDAQASAE